MNGPIVQIAVSDHVQIAAVRLVGLGLVALLVAGVVAGLYRWRTTRPFPPATGTFLGVATVALWMLWELLAGGGFLSSLPLEHDGNAVYGVGVILTGAVLGTSGSRLGDRIGCEIYALDRIDADGEVADLLRSARVVTPVALPASVEDVDGYLPATPATKRALSERQFLLPSGLSDRELRSRVESRIVTDFAVDHAGLTVEDGDVTALAVGRRVRGLGPTLPPGTTAVGIRADPPATTSQGERVEIWETDGGQRLVARGRLRSTNGDLATVVVDEDAAPLRPDRRYRLVTPPARPADHERLVSILRSVEETTVRVPIADGDPLEGEFVDWLPGAVLVVERDDGILVLPDDRTTLRAGDTAYLVGHPDELASITSSPGVNCERPGPELSPARVTGAGTD